VGFLDEGCPHRGASLALARNEDCALRCIFHGWKIDVVGKIVETPSEPEGSNLASKVRVKYYPVREAGGVIWVWLGKGEQPPQFPAFEFTALPLEQVVVRKALLDCNWAQVLEGFLDSAHVTSLHRSWLPQDNTPKGAYPGVMGDLAPRYQIEDRPYGYMANAIRTSPDGTQVSRRTEYVLPWYAFIPNALPTLHSMAVAVPIDDEHTTYWTIAWDMAQPTDAATIDRLRNLGQLGADPDNYYFPRAGADKIWGQNRELMKAGSYAGFVALPFEDFAVQESQGPIADRTKEKLGVSDVAIIRMRRMLLELAHNYQEGKNPRMLEQEIDYGMIQAVHEIISPTGERVEVTV
jgi:hypothetical protein